jgi:PAS domain S-box-containing protein
MKEKISFLKFFYESGKYADAPGLVDGSRSRTSSDSSTVTSEHNLFTEAEKLLQSGSWSWNASTDQFTASHGLFMLLGLGHANDSLNKTEYLQFFTPPFREALRERMTRSILTGEDMVFEGCLRDAKGVLKDVTVKARVVKDQFGMHTMMFGVVRDVTTTRTLDEAREQSIRELNRVNQELEEFAYIASHDLQEPLRKISMFTERLKTKLGNLPEDAELLMKRIESNSANMKILIDNLLELSRAQHGFLAAKSVCLHQIADQVSSDLELKIEESKTRISFQGTLPEIDGVATGIKQLFTNILSNAIKFRKPNQPSEIDIRCVALTDNEKTTLGLDSDRNYYRIEFQDRGIGFEQIYADKIFQVFQRLHGRSEYPGSGIGLAICKKIVDNHQGLIFAQSAPGAGSTFTVILPEKQT